MLCLGSPGRDIKGPCWETSRFPLRLHWKVLGSFTFCFLYWNPLTSWYPHGFVNSPNRNKYTSVYNLTPKFRKQWVGWTSGRGIGSFSLPGSLIIDQWRREQRWAGHFCSWSKRWSPFSLCLLVMWSVKPGNPFCSQIDYSAVSAVDLSFEDEGLLLRWSSVVEWTLSSLTEMLPHQPSLPFLVHRKAHFYSLMHSHLLTISASFNLITFTYKYKYKYFCFPSLACFLLPPPPRFPAESVTMLCMPSSHGWQWDWWSFQVSVPLRSRFFSLYLKFSSPRSLR